MRVTPKARTAAARPFILIREKKIVDSDAIGIRYKEWRYGSVYPLFNRKTKPKECDWRRLEGSQACQKRQILYMVEI